MELVPLGRSGLSVTRMGFGAWAIGGTHYGDVDHEQAIATVAKYVESGGNFVDTARRYGQSEEILGKYMKAAGNRSRLIVASKTHTLEEEEIRAELAISLAALQTDYVDLYYLHQPPEDVATMHQVLDVFQKLKSEGKIRAVGASIKGPDVSQGTVDLCRQYIQSGKVDALQVIFSICRGKTREIFEEAHAAGVAIVARTVLESGFLTGKYKAGHTFSAPDHRHRWGQERLDTILADVATLQKQCVKAPYTSLAQFSTRFAYDTPGVTAIIPGARSPEQMAANLGVLQVGPMAAGLRDTTAAVFAGQDARFNTQ